MVANRTRPVAVVTGASSGIGRALAVELARQAEQLTVNAYKAGVVDYTTVVQSQATSLSSQQSALTIRQTRLTASVSLIEALGGGWNASALPSGHDLVDRDGNRPHAAESKIVPIDVPSEAAINGERQESGTGSR